MATNTRTGRRPARGAKAATRTKTKSAVVEEEIDELEEADVEEVEEAPQAKPKRKAPVKKAPAKKAAPVEDDDENDDETDEEDDAPAEQKAKRKPPVRREIEFGTKWLTDFILEKTGKDYKPYDLRVLLRRMANKGELEREVGTDRGRYEFEGPKDPVVKAIIAKVKDGEIEKGKKASLDKLKDSQKGKRAKKKAAAEEDVEDEEIDDDVEDLDDEEEDDE